MESEEPQPSTSGRPVHVEGPSTATAKTPKQDEIKAKIADVSEEVNVLYKKKTTGLISPEQLKTLKDLEKQLQKLKVELEQLQSNQKRQQQHRLNVKRKLDDLDDETKEKLKKASVLPKEKPGRPSKTDDAPLIDAITEIALGGSAADDRRRSELIRTVRTLDDLTHELQKRGFNMSRSSVYLRLQPRSARTQEGKRHVTTAPVKLARCQNDKHSAHEDGKFARTSIWHLEELASVLGPEEVTFHSQDDKARIPIGITAANKQAPMLLNMEYKVTLSDHDFVIAPSHKLIPSVIASIEIRRDSQDAVTYSGPTYVALRSAKHSGSTAYAHLYDMKHIHELDQFKRDLYNSKNLVKPVFICTVDGGPDENPRYHNTIKCAVDYFVSYDLDAFFLATNAPGRSAFNRVERRMAPLSHDLAGLVLPHNHFGNHLDNSGNTIDVELE